MLMPFFKWTCRLILFWVMGRDRPKGYLKRPGMIRVLDIGARVNRLISFLTSERGKERGDFQNTRTNSHFFVGAAQRKIGKKVHYCHTGGGRGEKKRKLPSMGGDWTWGNEVTSTVVVGGFVRERRGFSYPPGA